MQEIISLGLHKIKLWTEKTSAASGATLVQYTASVEIFTGETESQNIYYTSYISQIDAINGLAACINANTAIINFQKSQEKK